MSIVKDLVEELLANNLTISTMESCTGGGLANEITNVPGCSEAFKFGAATYSNEFKIKMGVSSKVIDEFSVYSSQTAEEMSRNIVKFTGSDFGVGITGKLKRFDHANDYGDDDLVHVCVYDSQNNICHHGSVRVLYGTREENKQQVIVAASKLALNAINLYLSTKKGI